MKDDKYATAVGFLQGSLSELKYNPLAESVKQKLKEILEKSEAILKEEVCETCGYWGGCDSTDSVRKCYHKDVYSDIDLISTLNFESCRGWLKKGEKDENS